MSNVIPFPQSEQKIITKIKNAQHNHDYEEMYDLFETYERHFELTEDLALKKCWMLNQMSSFLELREEAIILLKRGLSCYDDLMIYYVKSLNGLGQYYQTVEVINQIIDEVRDHKTRMALFPLKEYAQSKLDEDRQMISSSLAKFEDYNSREQTALVLQLIDNGHYQFKESVAHLLSILKLPHNIMSLMLEYLRFAEYDNEIVIRKYGQEVSVIPSNLTGLEHTTMKETVIPQVIQRLEEGALHIVDEAHHIMNNHSILLYPLEIKSLYHIDEWINAYDVYFKSLFGIEITVENLNTLEFIKSLDIEN